MNHKILNIIICPICHGKLTYDKKKSELICKIEKIAYPIQKNIPILTREKYRKI